MSGVENPKSVNIDPKWCVLEMLNQKACKLTRDSSIQDALRMFLQPIKNDDPKVDFYTMYKREATEYDTEYVQNYDEDLNTTLIFVSFCHDLVALQC